MEKSPLVPLFKRGSERDLSRGMGFKNIKHKRDKVVK